MSDSRIYPVRFTKKAELAMFAYAHAHDMTVQQVYESIAIDTLQFARKKKRVACGWCGQNHIIEQCPSQVVLPLES